MNVLLRVHIRIQTISNQFVDYVYGKGCIQGQRFQDFIMNSSPNVRYFLQMLARLPLLLAIHFWFLLGPYSENSILWIFWFIIKILVAHRMVRALLFNTKALFLYYLVIFLELFIATIEESFYWTIQNETNKFHNSSRVMISDNGGKSWWISAIVLLMTETSYFWLHVHNKRTLQTLCHLSLYWFVFILFLIPFVLPIFGIQPNMLSTIGFFMSKVRLAVLLFTKTLSIEKLDKLFDSTSLKEEIVKCASLEGKDESQSSKMIDYLQKRRGMNRNQEHILNYSSNDVRDILFIFGLLYFGISLTLEIFWYDSYHISDSVFLNSVGKFLLIWSTSFVPILIISICFIFIDKIMTGLSVWLVSWETTLIDTINVGSDGRVVHFTFFTLLLESGIPSSNTDMDVRSVITIAVLFYCFLVQKAAVCVGRNIIQICNRNPDLKLWFYLRVCVTFLILLINPIVFFAFDICEEAWLVFFASGSVVLISNVMFILIECSLVSLTWYNDQYLSTLEDSIQYIQIAKHCSCIVLLSIQFYARYTLSVFRAWWIVRACYLILTYIALAVIPILQQQQMYDKNRKMLCLLQNLPEVSYAPLHGDDHAEYTCSICFSMINNGKELPCKHVFHAKCLRQWFNVRTVCPICNLVLQ